MYDGAALKQCVVLLTVIKKYEMKVIVQKSHKYSHEILV